MFMTVGKKPVFPKGAITSPKVTLSASLARTVEAALGADHCRFLQKRALFITIACWLKVVSQIQVAEYERFLVVWASKDEKPSGGVMPTDHH